MSASLYTRPHEVLLEVLKPDAGICVYDDAPLTQAVFCWDHRISTGPTYKGPWQLGEDRFTSYRHTDGSRCRAGLGGSWGWPKPQCAECGAVDQFDLVQESYLDRSTCRACGHEVVRMIGD